MGVLANKACTGRLVFAPSAGIVHASSFIVSADMVLANRQ